MVQPQAQASFEYSFIPAQPMAGRPFGLVILLNYVDSEVKGKKDFIEKYWWLMLEVCAGEFFGEKM